MSLAVETAEKIPLATNHDGIICVAGTRVTLDTIAAAFEEGATAEEIAQQYPSVSLADVYSVIGYLLRHRDEVADYLAQRAAQHKTVQQQNENRFSSHGIRERLMARRTAGKQNGK